MESEQIRYFLQAHTTGRITLPEKMLEKMKEELLNNRKKSIKEKNYKNKQILKQQRKEQLEEKLSNEFASLCEKIMLKKPEEILCNSYEIVLKSELKNNLISQRLDYVSLTNLVTQENTLDAVYQELQKQNAFLKQEFDNTILSAINTLNDNSIKEYIKEYHCER